MEPETTSPTKITSLDPAEIARQVIYTANVENKRKLWQFMGTIFNSLMAPLVVALIIFSLGKLNDLITESRVRDTKMAEIVNEVRSLKDSVDGYKESNDIAVKELVRKQDNMGTTLTQISTVLEMKGLMPVKLNNP